LADRILLLYNDGMSRRKTTKEFIADAQAVHRDKYGYKNVDYKNRHKKVEILCNTCQAYFWQTPGNHLHGQGCPCCNDAKKTTEEFIAAAIVVHGNDYGYGRVNYKNTRTKVEIRCNTCHEYFWQKASGHLKGRGCPKLHQIRKTTEQAIFDFQVVHGNDYGYGRVNYKNTMTKVEIRCNTCHEYFWQTPCSHLHGRGCPSCFRNYKKTTEQAVFDFQAIHGNDYGYGRVDYKNARTKVEIRCNTCHEYFWQKPNHHLNGQGCPSCLGTHTKTTEEFITKAKAIHGNAFEYKNTFYTNSYTNLEIFCKSCRKAFLQAPGHHLRGRGCPFCRLIILKDGTEVSSRIEAYCALYFTAMGIEFSFDKLYGGNLGKRRYDFFLPKYNTYIEVTSFSKDLGWPKKWLKYLRNIIRKKHYVENVLGANFLFIQHNLTSQERRYIAQNTKARAPAKPPSPVQPYSEGLWEGL
jgi:formylmethanofuran dehydrogenase subunit E